MGAALGGDGRGRAMYLRAGVPSCGLGGSSVSEYCLFTHIVCLCCCITIIVYCNTTQHNTIRYDTIKHHARYTRKEPYYNRPSRQDITPRTETKRTLPREDKQSTTHTRCLSSAASPQNSKQNSQSPRPHRPRRPRPRARPAASRISAASARRSARSTCRVPRLRARARITAAAWRA